jgi:hypothetical protein
MTLTHVVIKGKCYNAKFYEKRLATVGWKILRNEVPHDWQCYSLNSIARTTKSDIVFMARAKM